MDSPAVKLITCSDWPIKKWLLQADTDTCLSVSSGARGVLCAQICQVIPLLMNIVLVALGQAIKAVTMVVSLWIFCSSSSR